MGEADKALNRSMGARVRKAREDRGMSQNDLAEIVGLGDGQALSKYERGERGFSHVQLGRIADAFGLTTDYLAHGKEYAQRKADAALQTKSPRKSPQEVQVALTSLGYRMDTDPNIPAPILELINLGWLKPITNDDIQHLRVHLATGGSWLPHDLLLAVWSGRLQVNGTDENEKGLLEANRRRAEAQGGKHSTERESSASRNFATQEAANDEQLPKMPPRPKRKK